VGSNPTPRISVGTRQAHRSDNLDLDQAVFLYIVFVCVFFLLLLIDHYASSIIIGEEDYLSLIFVILFTRYKNHEESRYY
jgi:hypothetical protein